MVAIYLSSAMYLSSTIYAQLFSIICVNIYHLTLSYNYHHVLYIIISSVIYISSLFIYHLSTISFSSIKFICYIYLSVYLSPTSYLSNFM